VWSLALPSSAHAQTPAPAEPSVLDAVKGIGGLFGRVLGQTDKGQSTDAAAEAAARPKANPAAFNIDSATLDLMRPDGAACKAVADGGTFSNAAVLLGAGLSLSVEVWSAKGNFTSASFQSALRATKPILKEWSKQVVWLPVEIEAHVGRALMEFGQYKEWVPRNPRQIKFIDNTIRPVFEILRAYAVDELAAPHPFRLLFINDDAQTSPSVLPGGLVIIPSGMVTWLMALENPDDVEQVLAFQLAHEFSHALRRHNTKNAQMMLVDGLMIADVFSKQFKGTASQFRQLGKGGGLQEIFDLSAQGIGQIMGAVCVREQLQTTYEGHQELEADTCGALLMEQIHKRRGVRMNALSGFKLYRSHRPVAPAGVPASPAEAAAEFCVKVASHPEMEVREQNLARYVRALEEQRSREKN
jgi:Zn-dependent protease with chaperone function